MQRCPECGREYPVSAGYCPMDGAKLVDVVVGPAAADGWKLILPQLVRREAEVTSAAPVEETSAASAEVPTSAPMAGGVDAHAHGPKVRAQAPAMSPAFSEMSARAPAKTIVAFGGGPRPDGAPRASDGLLQAAVARAVVPSTAAPVGAAALHLPVDMHLKAPRPAPEEALVGRVLDQRYRIDAKLGAGGMGVVYRATHVIIDKPLAVKVLRSEHASHPEVLQRFVLEAQLASQIKHPNVVDISDYGQIEGVSAYYVMEHLSGRTLAQAIQSAGRIAPERALEIAIQAARGLGAAHDRGIVHRDLKPDNIFLCGEEGRETVKLLDFGIARVVHKKSRLTAQGVLVGTPAYMSPEQAQSSSVDHRSDLYSLGVILFEMLTGQVPFGDKGPMETVNQHMFRAPPSLREVAPDLPPLPALERVLRGLLAKDRGERPQSAGEVIRLLEAARAGDLEGGSPGEVAPAPEPATEPATAPAAAPSERRRSPTVNLGSGSVVALLASQSGAGPAVNEDALTQPRGDRRAVAAPRPEELEPVDEADAATPRQVTPSGRIEKRPSVIVRRGTPVERFVPPPPRRAPEPASALAALSSDALERRGAARSGPPMALVIGVAAIVAMAITMTVWKFWLKGGRAEAPAVAAAPQPPPREVVRVRLESSPPGAEILRGGKDQIGQTPLDVELLRSGEGQVFIFRLPGHVDAARTIVPDRAHSVLVPLEPLPPPQPPPAGADEASAKPAPATAVGAGATDGASRPAPRPRPRPRPEGEATATSGPAERPEGGELGDLKDPFARGGGG